MFRCTRLLRYRLIIPILGLWEHWRDIGIPLLPQDFGQALQGFLSSFVTVEAERDFLKLWILLQHPEHGMFRDPAESGIAVRLPALWVVVAGADKSDIVRRAFTGPFTPEIPCFVLQMHPDVTLVGKICAIPGSNVFQNKKAAFLCLWAGKAALFYLYVTSDPGPSALFDRCPARLHRRWCR